MASCPPPARPTGRLAVKLGNELGGKLSAWTAGRADEPGYMYTNYRTLTDFEHMFPTMQIPPSTQHLRQTYIKVNNWQQPPGVSNSILNRDGPFVAASQITY